MTVHVTHNSGNNEWYTPEYIIASARIVLGEIDLDPASCEMANRIVKATVYYSVENDGLTKHWSGRVWMNPPYSTNVINKFTSKFVKHFKAGDITAGIVLTNNATDTSWYAELVSCAEAIVFTKRIGFITADGASTGKPLQGQSLMYFGNNTKKFIEEFFYLGFGVIIAASQKERHDLYMEMQSMWRHRRNEPAN